MLGFPWAKAMVGSAQRMASCFHANSIASTLLAEEAKELGIDAQELPCNLSQVQSVHACLESLVNLELAVRQTLKKHPDLSVHHEVSTACGICLHHMTVSAGGGSSECICMTAL